MKCDECAARFAHERTGTVGGDEILSVSKVVQVEIDTPDRGAVPGQRIYDRVGRNRIDVGDIAVTLVLMVHAGADAKPGQAGDLEAIGRP